MHAVCADRSEHCAADRTATMAADDEHVGVGGFVDEHPAGFTGYEDGIENDVGRLGFGAEPLDDAVEDALCGIDEPSDVRGLLGRASDERDGALPDVHDGQRGAAAMRLMKRPAGCGHRRLGSVDTYDDALDVPHVSSCRRAMTPCSEPAFNVADHRPRSHEPNAPQQRDFPGF